MRSLRIAPFLLLLGAAGCGDEASPVAAPVTTTPPAEEPAKPVEEAPAPESAIKWEKCSLETGGIDGRAECADVEVPIDWNAPDGKKVTFFVKRVLGNAKGPKQQLWLLQGGPGGAGDGLEPLAEEIIARDDTVDIYIPDHRGTGRSAYLDCPVTFKSVGFDLPACAAEAEKIWGKGSLATFSTTTAARDVGYVIEKTRAKDQKVHVYGVSYGTYWAQRYLQLFPAQANAVTLDSVCQTGLCSLSKNSYWFDVVGKKYLAECAADSFCKEQLGGDPIATVRESIAKADAGTCAGLEGISGYDLKYFYTWFITSVSMRVMIPSLAHRIVRCNDDDVEALGNFVSTMQKYMGGSAGFATKDLSSDVLLLNVALSEMEEDPLPSASELGELMKDSLFSDADSAIEQMELYSTWPKYERDQFVGKYPDGATPVLLMNGSLDPQTPQEFADQIAPHYTKANQTYVVFPRAAHGVIHQSPTGPNGPNDEPCGTTVWRQFVEDPTKPLDTSCTSKILGHGFDSSWGSLAQGMYGRPSLWGPAPKLGAPNAPAPITPAASKAIESELRRAERDSRLLHLADRLRARSRQR